MKPRESNLPCAALPDPPLFQSFFLAGFECANHRLASGRRLDLVRATRHDVFAAADYERLSDYGLRAAREGVRWHLVESGPGRWDFSSVEPIVQAASKTRTQIIWDLCHFGWPDHIDVFGPRFISALAEYGAAFAKWLGGRTGMPGFFVPINEISFLSWAAGEEGSLYPFVTGRGFELKRQLVRAAIETMNAIWAEQPRARFVHVDPIINVVAHPRHPEEQPAAEAYRLLQYQSWDMLAGQACPELGGHDKYLGVIGVNYYPYNQWFYNLKGFRRVRKFAPIKRRSPLYRPLHEMLHEVHERYRRPTFIAETGAENRLRAGWLRYVCSQTAEAASRGVPIRGICLYPILNHPGWDDDRHCHNAVWDYPDPEGRRAVYRPLARELKRWQYYFEANESPPRSSRTNNRIFSSSSPDFHALSGTRARARAAAGANS